MIAKIITSCSQSYGRNALELSLLVSGLSVLTPSHIRAKQISSGIHGYLNWHLRLRNACGALADHSDMLPNILLLRTMRVDSRTLLDLISLCGGL